MEILDVKGLNCPMPLIKTKKALKELKDTESLKIIIDNETSVKNVLHFLNDNTIPVKQTKAGGIFELIVSQGIESIESLENVDETTYCTTSFQKRDSYVVLLAKNQLGEGSDELGKALAGAMIDTLKSMDTLPEKIIIINSGVEFVVKGSFVLKSLQELEQQGVDIIVCGTCLDYFGKMDELAVGRITNMHDILESMLKADKVINF
jgi:selenium metabolism protein YedF